METLKVRKIISGICKMMFPVMYINLGVCGQKYGYGPFNNLILIHYVSLEISNLIINLIAECLTLIADVREQQNQQFRRRSVP